MNFASSKTYFSKNKMVGEHLSDKSDDDDEEEEKEHQ